MGVPSADLTTSCAMAEGLDLPDQDLAQPGGECLRLAGLPVLAAEEAGVAVRERNRRRAELLGNGMRAPVGQFTLGLRAGREDDAGRGRPERLEVGLVVR